jgi:NADH-quinone oxidoreductase subunit J
MTFWMALFGVLTILSASGVVLARAPLNSALWLIMTFFFIAAHYGILGADFLAVIQIMVYAGAIMVLVVFVIMLLGSEAQAKERIGVLTFLFGGTVTLCLFGSLAVAISRGLPSNFEERGVVAGDAATLGAKLYTDFLFPFEITSLLILAAIIGAVVLGLDKRRALKAGRGLTATRKRIDEELKKAA